MTGNTPALERAAFRDAVAAQDFTRAAAAFGALSGTTFWRSMTPGGLRVDMEWRPTVGEWFAETHAGHTWRGARKVRLAGADAWLAFDRASVATNAASVELLNWLAEQQEVSNRCGSRPGLERASLLEEIDRCLEHLAAFEAPDEREDFDLDGASSVLEDLFKLIHSEDICELIASGVSFNVLRLEQAKWLLGVAVWSGNTNGSEQRITLERWLSEASDALHIELALSNGFYPFGSRREMVRKLGRVGAHFPEFKARCSELISNRSWFE
ncbi:MAG: hypothetical protein KC492_22635 [Myxococcales bacterium]|nr:hypothetical protein [Myxococcales bacterium]